MRNDRYLVEKVGEHEGPLQTSTASDFMKFWIPDISDVSDTSSNDSNDDLGDIRGRMSVQDGRM
ncbi:hypothetical protein K0M31_012634 [Melipona bicolor]|uniref:Uncharacterized protein n=1 Tax=Melipona bicolor TaxID=60889 RepID=A0AA40KH95_9HYME|nr:hypothetical protein K0M31_012634 [Melipona bicolor]